MMAEKNSKGQKGFAIVNIIVGVILVMAGFFMLTEPDVGPGGIISILLGAVFWGIGAYTLYIKKKCPEDLVRRKWVRPINTISFVLSCIVMAACIILPILAPLL